jgi:hypothetical protein
MIECDCCKKMINPIPLDDNGSYGCPKCWAIVDKDIGTLPIYKKEESQ